MHLAGAELAQLQAMQRRHASVLSSQRQRGALVEESVAVSLSDLQLAGQASRQGAGAPAAEKTGGSQHPPDAAGGGGQPAGAAAAAAGVAAAAAAAPGTGAHPDGSASRPQPGAMGQHRHRHGRRPSSHAGSGICCTVMPAVNGSSEAAKAQLGRAAAQPSSMGRGPHHSLPATNASGQNSGPPRMQGSRGRGPRSSRGGAQPAATESVTKSGASVASSNQVKGRQ